MNICLGITLKNEKCKIILKNKKYCNKHKNQEIINEIYIIKKELENISNKLKEISINNYYENDEIIVPYDNRYVKKYIKKNKIKFNIIDVPGDGDCGFHVISKFLKSKNKHYDVKSLKIILKIYNPNYNENEWIEILDISYLLNYFNYGTIFIENNKNNKNYYGFNIKEKIYNNCYIYYIKNLHFEFMEIIN